ncbi:unnamed protein product [Cuscuta campestris]|uniref:Protein kinase domain-containing protein n=1 Tax=Cuscuta campestris TaxID=132261 RepID=A0A484NRL3_9ASTE|nr:unnamed protein product [Cuscuta campestris]
MMPLKKNEQNSTPNDLRPLNIGGRTLPEDPRISPATSSGRPIDGYFASHHPRDANPGGGTIPVVYYSASGPSDAGYVGLGFSNAPPAVARWVQQVVPPTPVVAAATPSLGFSQNSPNNFNAQCSSCASDHASDEGGGGDESTPGRKLKFLCSFGGKILPRPSDGALRYVGGQTRIVSLRRDVSFPELVKKLTDTCGQDAVIKYQLPDEDLDALVSISCPDDFENMMDEYQKLVERSSDGSAKLRVFLFPPCDVDSPATATIHFAADMQDSRQRYVDAVNGIGDGGISGGITRLNSVSTQNSDVSSVEVGDCHGHPDIIARSPSSDAISEQDGASRMACNDTSSSSSPAVYVNTTSSCGIPMVMAGPSTPFAAASENLSNKPLPFAAASLQQQTAGYDLNQQAGVSFPMPSPHVPPYVDHQMGLPTQLMGTVGPVYSHHPQFVPAVHTTMSSNKFVPMFQPQQTTVLGGPHHGLHHHHHPVPYSPPLQVSVSDAQVVTLAHPTPRYDDCHMCQKSLPHAHSDTVAQDKRGSPVSSSIISADPFKLPRAATSGALLECPQSNVSTQYRPEAVASNAVPSDLLVAGMRLPTTTEYLTRESPNNYTGNSLPKEGKNDDSSNAYYGHLKHIEDKMENLRMQRDDILVNSEQNINNKLSPTVDNIRNTEFLESRSKVKPYEASPTSPNEAVCFQNIWAQDQPLLGKSSNVFVHSKQPGVNCLVPPNDISLGSCELIPRGTDFMSTDGNGSSLSASRELGGDAQESANSQFSNQDPWRMQHHDARFSLQPNKLQVRKDPVDDKVFLKDNTCSYLDMDFGLEHVSSNKGEELMIKQDLQTVAEDVAASVLPSSSTPNYGKGSSPSTSERSSVVQIGQGERQYRDKLEEVKTKLPVKESFGSPVSGDIGRLQRDDFWNEAIKLADLHHPNVVAFYGVVLDGPGGSVATVTEYMVNGSLRTALQKSERILDKRKRLLIAMDVAFGMEYLHGKNIVHFDLKSDNLLVNLRDPQRPICKVGDLGLSKVKCQTLISGGVRGTLPWMAPELLNGSSSLVCEKVDVFSFGIVMWELLTGEEPYVDLHYGAIIGGIVNNTLRPRVPETCDADWKALMERCWSAEPSERPTFTEIANELRAIAANNFPAKAPPQQPRT